VRVLLDTHVLLWWLVDDKRLTDLARRVMRSGESEIFFSAASSW